jgi:hypothetical protein
MAVLKYFLSEIKRLVDELNADQTDPQPMLQHAMILSMDLHRRYKGWQEKINDPHDIYFKEYAGVLRRYAKIQMHDIVTGYESLRMIVDKEWQFGNP